MWTCSRCGEEVEADFQVCWNCGTSFDGVEDPWFERADEARPIPSLTVELESVLPVELADDALDEPDSFPELVVCYQAASTIESKFVADRLMELGIPAVADAHDLNLGSGLFVPASSPRVYVRREDLERAREWIEAFTRRDRRDRPAEGIRFLEDEGL